MSNTETLTLNCETCVRPCCCAGSREPAGACDLHTTDACAPAASADALADAGAARVNAPTNLDELLEELESERISEANGDDLTSLPVYGGAELNGDGGTCVWSWDEDRCIISDGGVNEVGAYFEIISREDAQERGIRPVA